MRAWIHNNKQILILISAGFLLRIALSSFGTLDFDQNIYMSWGNRLVDEGFNNFYKSWSDYLPGYLYVLWFLSKISHSISISDEILYKIPAILSDIGVGYLIYKIVINKSKRHIALLASTAYLFNPAILGNSTLWGQVDGITAFFALLAVYLFPINAIFSAVALAVGSLMKIQAIVALPVLFYLALGSRQGIKNFIKLLVVSLAIFVLAFTPFWYENNLVTFALGRVTATLDQYKYTSINAFNYWGLFGFWKTEEAPLLSKNILGWVMALSLSAIVFFKGFNKKKNEYFFLAIFMMANFFFFTRIHERHLLPAFAPLAIVAATNPILWLSYAALSFTYVLNLMFAINYINNDFGQLFSSPTIKALIFINLSSLALVLYVYFSNKKIIIPKRKTKAIKLTSVLSKSQTRNILISITVLSLAARMFMLENPKKEYFDEIYHAFTARTALNGDPKAWEWWNPNPDGFAYEWTHPPVAKIGMMAGMKVLGENSLGWRTPSAILSTATIPVIYLVAYELFKNRDIAILSSVIYALDGLPLVMGRIGMNDTYFVFFGMLSLYFFLKHKYLASSLIYGLSLSSKWSALWLLPIFAVIFLSENKKLIYKLSIKKINKGILWFGVIPLAVYIASYIPMFLSGHGLDIFWGTQKQMWWYHTRLDATHPFTSPWWSWPVLKRPVWLFVNRPENGVIQNIYIMGNPIIFWFGLLSIFLSSLYAYIDNNKKLGLIVFGYIALFIPWALSPRIMFLYHYLPSIPFLAIATGYVLKRNSQLIIPILTISTILFIYFYPHWTGISIPVRLDNSYYWFNSWR